ncbi:hypothetical protein SAMN05192574_103104 [Mucilaginibacter gossypiicola]|uniref:Uncharacterized protein n=1 Tax=Mucilaginibacter gossypiicola TaxID=551995 RepID=A0A1H8GE65_9SPHI|nr:hypothetical protein SAMN05192574_103104 [Mucilaginibacter gossypiicola]
MRFNVSVVVGISFAVLLSLFQVAKSTIRDFTEFLQALLGQVSTQYFLCCSTWGLLPHLMQFLH